MPATLGSLLNQEKFRLRMIAGANDDDPVMEEPITWVHSSDLIDPTPWLEPGQLLLTDGVHFSAVSTSEFAVSYVRRLQERGVRALGFATGIAHDEIPPILVDVCGNQGFPLFEVADRTPFMGIIRHVADVISQERQERLNWSMRAQRAVARAALRPDGLGAILLELEAQLDCWVALFDSVGNRVVVRTNLPMPDQIGRAVAVTVRTVLERGTRSGIRLIEGGEGVTLQTLGQRDKLRGVLAVGTPTPLDPAENDLVASVIGLASIALEHSRALDATRQDLRSGLLELLLAGMIDVVGRTARRLWGRLPSEPVRVSIVAGTVRAQSLIDELELYAGEHGGRLFFADRDGEVVVVTGDDDTTAFEEILQRHGMSAGVSAPVLWGELSRGLVEARRSARRASGEGAFIRFENLADEGLFGFLEAAGALPIAHRILQPLLDRPAPERDTLIQTAHTWLTNNCAWDPSAKALGVHRHTLRNRITALEGILSMDLETFEGRAELWTALQLLEP